MGKINELAISDSNVNMNIVEKYGTFRLQSDKQITENGKHTADVGFNGLSSVNVNVSGGGGADLEDNKTVSITENGVVEITPSEGKDGMKKVTATVNVSGGGATKLYAWFDKYNFVYTTTPTPSVGDKVILSSDSSTIIEAGQVYSVTEEGMTIDDYEEASVYIRSPRQDIDLV